MNGVKIVCRHRVVSKFGDFFKDLEQVLRVALRDNVDVDIISTLVL